MGRTSRPPDWSTATLDTTNFFYSIIEYVATPCAGGIEYKNGLTADSATIVSGSSPDQYGYAVFTADATSYLLDTTTPVTVLAVAKDEASSGYSFDFIAFHGQHTSPTNNAGWIVTRNTNANLGGGILNNSFVAFAVAHAASAGTVRNLMFSWDADAAAGSRFLTLDVNSAPTGTTTSSLTRDAMRVPAVADKLTIGSALETVQLVVVLRGGLYSTTARNSFLANPWQVFADSALVAPIGIPSEEFVPNPVVTYGDATVTPTGIASAEAFGTAVVTQGDATVFPTGIASAEAFGTAAVTGPTSQVVTPAGIASAEAFGTPNVTAETFSLGCLLSDGTGAELEAWLLTDVRPDGTVQSESKSAITDQTFSLRYHTYTLADATAVENYLTSKELVSFSFTWEDGVEYSATIDSPVKKSMVAGAEWDVTTTLRGRPA